MKVVQITDLHLYSDIGGSDDPTHPVHHAALAAVLDDIQASHPDLGTLVISGDVAAITGSQPIDELAYRNLRRELLGRGELLSRTRVIPGNHDNRRLLLATLPVNHRDPRHCDLISSQGRF